jgi:hypothetical protein
MIYSAESQPYDEYAHGLVGNLSGIVPMLTPCARKIYDNEEAWPALTVDTMFPGDPDTAVRELKLVRWL